jgi:hypothetical protein
VSLFIIFERIPSVQLKFFTTLNKKVWFPYAQLNTPPTTYMHIFGLYTMTLGDLVEAFLGEKRRKVVCPRTDIVPNPRVIVFLDLLTAALV